MYAFEKSILARKEQVQSICEYPPRFVLPLTWRPDFLEHEKQEGDKKGAPTMEVAWSVWFKGSNETIYLPLQKPEITKQSKKSNKLF